MERKKSHKTVNNHRFTEHFWHYLQNIKYFVFVKHTFNYRQEELKSTVQIVHFMWKNESYDFICSFGGGKDIFTILQGRQLMSLLLLSRVLSPFRRVMFAQTMLTKEVKQFRQGSHLIFIKMYTQPEVATL